MLPPGPLQQSLVNEADNQSQGFEGGNQCGASAAGESDDGRSQRDSAAGSARAAGPGPGLGRAAAAGVTAAQTATLATSAVLKGHARPVIADGGRRANQTNCNLRS